MDLATAVEQLQAAGTEQNRRIYRRHGVRDPLYGVSFAVLDTFGAMISIGVRNATLRAAAEATAGRIGIVKVDHGETACVTLAAVPYSARTWDRKAGGAAKATHVGA